MSGSIPASAIVNVTPGVLAAGGTALDLNGLLLTTNNRVPIGTVPSFPSLAAVTTYFGPSAAETALAASYFLGFDNSNVKPGAMLFAQYPWKAAVFAYLRGGNISALTLTQLQALSGVLVVTIDGTIKTSSAINLSSITSFSNAATVIQAALAITGTVGAVVTASNTTTVMTVTAVASGTLAAGQILSGGTYTTGTFIVNQLTGTPGGIGTYTVSASQTVTSGTITATNPAVFYDSIAGAFTVASGTTGVASTIGFGSGTISAGLMLTQATGAITSQGAAVATPGGAMAGILPITQNWCTFSTAFEPVTADKVLFAAWANSQNNRYLYSMWDTDVTATQSGGTSSAGYLIQQAGYSGTAAIYAPTNMATMGVFLSGAIASIDFTETNGRATLAFRSQSGIVPDVTSQTVAQNLQAQGYNYYGNWATSNDTFSFFYPGSVSGKFLWLDSYINEIWLNNGFQLALMELLIAVKSIPYNAAGYALTEAACMDPINAGLLFGAFRPGVTLSQAQIAEVNNAAGLPIATTLQTRGWYLLIQDASPQVRVARGSPPMTFWYMDGQSVQAISLASIEVQ